MAIPISKSAFGREAGCSRQAVAKAIAAGHLIAGHDGKLDPAEPQNAVWIARRHLGLSGDGSRIHHPERIWLGDGEVLPAASFDWDEFEIDVPPALVDPVARVAAELEDLRERIAALEAKVGL